MLTETSHFTNLPPPRTYHFKADTPTDAESWVSAIKHTQVSGIPLAEQQLTSNGIPILVHKCLQFVESHGMEAEGLYRLSGGKVNSRKLVLAFNQGEQERGWSLGQLSCYFYLIICWCSIIVTGTVYNIPLYRCKRSCDWSRSVYRPWRDRHSETVLQEFTRPYPHPQTLPIIHQHYT